MGTGFGQSQPQQQPQRHSRKTQSTGGSFGGGRGFGRGGGRGSGRGEEMDRLAGLLEDDLGLKEYLESTTEDLRLELSPGARLMLLIPLAEAAEAGVEEGEVDRERVEESVSTMLVGIAEEPARLDALADQESRFAFGTRFRRRRTSFSVIKAFWRKFCNIPPFCGEGER